MSGRTLRFAVRVFVLALVVSVGATASRTMAGPPAWPQFRGDELRRSSRRRAAAAGRVRAVAELSVEDGSRIGHSSPCIWGDRIFLTDFDPAENKLETLCINRQNGQIVWRQAAPAEKIEKSHELGNPAASTAVADADRVYVYFGSYGLLCYDHAGNEQWKLPVKTPQARFGTATSPVLVDGRLVLNYQGGYVVAIDAKTGEEVWKNAKLPFTPDYALPVARKAGDVTEMIIQGTGGMAAVDLSGRQPALAGAGLCHDADRHARAGRRSAVCRFVSSDRQVGRPDRPHLGRAAGQVRRGRRQETGREGASRKTGPRQPRRPRRRGDMTFRQMMFMLDRNGDKKIDALEWTGVEMFAGQINNALMAFRPDDDGKISKKEMVWKAEQALPESPSPLYYRGNLYLVKNGGVLSCYEAATGKLHYQKRLEAAGSYYASPVAGDGKIYTSSMDGIVAVVEAGDELQVLARNNLEERLMATPAIVDGKLYIRTAGHLYAFGK